MAIPFGTLAFQGMSRKQLGAKYEEVRAAVLATDYGRKHFTTPADFNAHVAHFSQGETGIRRERGLLLSAFGQFHLALTETRFIPPSPETLAWGGFLGGDYCHDSRAADAACLALLG